MEYSNPFSGLDMEKMENPRAVVHGLAEVLDCLHQFCNQNDSQTTRDLYLTDGAARGLGHILDTVARRLYDLNEVIGEDLELLRGSGRRTRTGADDGPRRKWRLTIDDAPDDDTPGDDDASASPTDDD